MNIIRTETARSLLFISHRNKRSGSLINSNACQQIIIHCILAQSQGIAYKHIVQIHVLISYFMIIIICSRLESEQAGSDTTVGKFRITWIRKYPDLFACQMSAHEQVLLGSPYMFHAQKPEPTDDGQICVKESTESGESLLLSLIIHTHNPPSIYSGTNPLTELTING